MEHECSSLSDDFSVLPESEGQAAVRPPGIPSDAWRVKVSKYWWRKLRQAGAALRAALGRQAAGR